MDTKKAVMSQIIGAVLGTGTGLSIAGLCFYLSEHFGVSFGALIGGAIFLVMAISMTGLLWLFHSEAK